MAIMLYEAALDELDADHMPLDSAKGAVDLHNYTASTALCVFFARFFLRRRYSTCCNIFVFGY